ncbi:MAG: ATP-binding cassette domain-containing protein [Elusimicrobia bacterium]|nr:ATP-binding cassette domain-containing protein [Elusimicrobiota bacterium]
MIEVENLAKYYGSVKAVDGISFSVGKGEIVGVLGPNGAGKTTMLRVLAGYFPQTSGVVRILERDNTSEGLEIKREIGYLPENNPIYETMEVTEYLSFLWDIRRPAEPDRKDKRLKEIMDSCNLGSVAGKDIGELSKGFRQRVGLAAAILHDPAILLLDEPTSGLDPIQAREVRELIGGFKTQKTILLSTHILPEVHAICDRVLIIHKGKLAADKPLEQLDTSEEYLITAGFERNIAGGQDLFAAFDGVLAVEGPEAEPGAGQYSWRIRAAQDIRGRIFECAASKKLPLIELRMEKKSLEEIFHELTK